jgi:hypothetical protein
VGHDWVRIAFYHGRRESQYWRERECVAVIDMKFERGYESL